MSSGIAFHCHHDILVEYVWDKQDRETYIKTRKPTAERPLRLKLFQLIPPELLPPEVDRAWAEVGSAMAEVARAWAEASRAIAEVGGAIQANLPALEELHRRLCPDCPWDGKTIFPKKVK